MDLAVLTPLFVLYCRLGSGHLLCDILKIKYIYMDIILFDKCRWSLPVGSLIKLRRAMNNMFIKCDAYLRPDARYF